MQIGVIFDLDGVIVDSEHISLKAFQRAMAEQGVYLSPEDLWQCCGLTDQSIVQQLEEKYGRKTDLKKFARRKFEIYSELVETEGLRVFPGTMRLLAELEEAGIPFAAASSGPRQKIKLNLSKVNLYSRFKVVVSGDDVVQSKPAPDIFLKAAGLIGRSPAQCIVIEDSPNGLRGAKTAGMKTVALRTTFKDDLLLKEADMILDSVKDLGVRQLLAILERCPSCGDIPRS